MLVNEVLRAEPALTAIVTRLARVPGVVAVTLGGSRALGTHRPDSDTDLGVYFRGTLAAGALRALAHGISDDARYLVRLGRWGPWFNGSGRVYVGGRQVDWMYRNLDLVHRVWRGCQRGRYQVMASPGHPLGFYSHTFAGEVALCRVLEDPSGQLGVLNRETSAYPAALGEALVAGLEEADLSVELARYGATGGDPGHAAGCLYHAVGVACQALHGHHRRWLLSNEKGMVAATGRLPAAPPRFTERVGALFTQMGTAPETSVDEAATLIAEVRDAIKIPATVAGLVS